MIPDLNKLRTFCCVAKMGSVTKAAWHLNRTQSAITQQLQLLEEDLGLALLERRNARVYLTSEGERLYAFAARRFQELEDEVLKVKKDTEDLEGLIRISALDEIQDFILPDLVAAFSRKHPKVHFEIVSAGHADVECHLIENRADFGLMVLYEDRKMFKITPFYSYQMTCVASPEYLEKTGPVESFEALLERDIIDALHHIPAFRYWVKKNAPHLASSFDSKEAYISIRGSSLIRHLVLKGRGIAMLPSPPIGADLKKGRLVEILPEEARRVNVVADIARRSKTTKHLLHDRFLDFVKETAKTTLTRQP